MIFIKERGLNVIVNARASGKTIFVANYIKENKKETSTILIAPKGCHTVYPVCSVIMTYTKFKEEKIIKELLKLSWGLTIIFDDINSLESLLDAVYLSKNTEHTIIYLGNNLNA